MDGSAQETIARLRRPVRVRREHEDDFVIVDADGHRLLKVVLNSGETRIFKPAFARLVADLINIA